MNPLDHFTKRVLKEKYYIRYADDFVILSCDYDHLLNLIPVIRTFLADTLKLELHPNKIVLQKWSQGIDFLGYIVFPHHILLRTKTKKRMFIEIRNNCQLLKDGLMSKEKFKQSLQSYLGILKHCRGKTITKGISLLIKLEKG